MSFPAFASARWIRQRYSYSEEFSNRISQPSPPDLVISPWHRYVERMTAHLFCAGVDSDTVRAAITSTLPTIYIPGGGTDNGSGASDWTTQQPEIIDIDGGNSEVVCTWEKTTAWVEV